jgi:hypothetical protein
LEGHGVVRSGRLRRGRASAGGKRCRGTTDIRRGFSRCSPSGWLHYFTRTALARHL